MKDKSLKFARNQNVVESLLKEIRINAGMRQIDIASKLGFQQSIVSKYESGERRLDILEIREICHILNISLLDFVLLLEEKLETENETH